MWSWLAVVWRHRSCQVIYLSMMLKIRSPASSIAKTAKEFAERTSVHGVGYVADKNVPLFSNLLWAFVCILSMSLAIYLSVESYNQWQERPVITTLKSTAKPVTEIPFPTVTICGSGLYMKNVEIALEKNFNQSYIQKTGVVGCKNLQIILNFLQKEDCIRAPPKRGRYWEIDPQRPILIVKNYALFLQIFGD